MDYNGQEPCVALLLLAPPGVRSADPGLLSDLDYRTVTGDNCAIPHSLRQLALVSADPC